MTKLIESTSTVVLPSGITITTLHLTAEAKRGLSTGGAEIPPPLPDPAGPLPLARVIRRRWWWPW